MKTTILPPQPRNPWKPNCGICESVRTDHNGVRVCPHCDIPCKPPSWSTGGCGICSAGMKGLPEREEI